MSKVAVCMTIWNRNGVYQVSLRNMFEQTYTDMKFYVVDDCSTDGGIFKLGDLNQNYPDIFKLYRTQERNYIDAMNLAFSKVEDDCEYITWIDSDDYVSANKLEAQVKYLEEHPDVDICGCLTSFGNKEGHVQVLAPTLMNYDHKDAKKMIDNGNGINTFCLFQSCMFRRRVLDIFTKKKFFYDEYIGGHAGEGFLYTLFAKGFKFASINNVAYVYNVGKIENSMTNTIVPVFANEMNSLPWKERKKEILRLFKKYNGEEEVSKQIKKEKKVKIEEAVSEAPKKRGRPKKNVEPTETPIEKKKRGRPKKEAPVTQVPPTEAPTTKKPKTKKENTTTPLPTTKGRTKKSATTEPPTIEIKKRGRKKKTE